MRELLTKDILAKTFVGYPEELISGYKEAMGITIMHEGEIVSLTFQVAFLVISGIIFIGIAALLQSKRNVMSR